MDLTLDSCVIVAALREQEAMHKECKALLQQVKEGRHRAFESMIVPVEITAAIRRRTDSKRLARQARENLLRLDCFIILALTESRMNSAARIAERISLKGMDAIIAQVSEERGSVLVTLDEEFAERAQQAVTVKDVKTILAEVEAEDCEEARKSAEKEGEGRGAS
jgi:predicted nucleic acid-binding protein